MGFWRIGDLLPLFMVDVNKLSQEFSAFEELLFGIAYGWWTICADLILQIYQLFPRLQLGKFSFFSLTSL